MKRQRTNPKTGKFYTADKEEANTMENFCRDTDKAFVRVVKKHVLPKLTNKSFETINAYVDANRSEITTLIRFQLIEMGHTCFM